MAPLNSSQIAAELQRKRNLGIAPTNKANLTAYNGLLPQKPAVKLGGTTPAPATPSPSAAINNAFSNFGGKDNYAAKQNERWQGANASGDTGLMDRLKADSARAKYTLNPYAPKTETKLDSAATNGPTVPTTSDTLTKIMEMMNKQATRETPQFNYDANSDPVYQAALSRAKANAGTASGNAQAEMNRRGILNSTITGDRLGQIEQAEYGRVSDTVLPQLMQQAYGRYRDSVGDQVQSDNSQLANLQNLLSTTNGLDQQGWENRFNYGQATGTFANGQKTLGAKGQEYDQAADTRNYDRGVLESDRNFNQGKYESDRNYRLAVQQQSVSNGQWQQQFNMDVERLGFQQASELWSQAFQENQAGQDDEYRKATLEQEMTQNDRAAANQATDSIFKSGLVTTTKDPNTGTETMSVTNPDSLNNYIKSLNLSDNATDSLLYQYGLDSFVKK